MNAKRFSIGTTCMIPCQKGDWVMHDDYEYLKKAYDKLKDEYSILKNDQYNVLKRAFDDLNTQYNILKNDCEVLQSVNAKLRERLNDNKVEQESGDQRFIIRYVNKDNQFQFSQVCTKPFAKQKLENIINNLHGTNVELFAISDCRYTTSPATVTVTDIKKE